MAALGITALLSSVSPSTESFNLSVLLGIPNNTMVRSYLKCLLEQALG